MRFFRIMSPRLGDRRRLGAMVRVLTIAVVCAVHGSTWGGVSAEREVVDATGAKVKLSAQPSRIVTLAPSLGELAADLSEDEISRIVGVSEFSDYPPMLMKVPSVGSYAKFNLEKVFALKPDLVLATLDGNSKDQVLHLRELGLPVVVVATESLSDVEASMRMVGLAMGVPQRGERMAAQFARGLQRIREKASRPGVRRVLIQVGGDPLVVVGAKSFLHDVVVAIGGVNVYADSAARYPRPSIEDVLRRNPDVIVVLSLGKDEKAFRQMAARWAKFPGINAVKSGRVRVLKGDQVVRPTIRLLEGLSLLEKAVQE
jgi:iron complex transport system substrate-binding protein